MTDLKDKIIAELEVLAAVAPLETAGTFKARAYATGIKTIAALPRVQTAEDLPPAAKGDGLGKEIRAKILRILEHGSLDIDPEVRAKAAATRAANRARDEREALRQAVMRAQQKKGRTK